MDAVIVSVPGGCLTYGWWAVPTLRVRVSTVAELDSILTDRHNRLSRLGIRFRGRPTDIGRGWA